MIPVDASLLVDSHISSLPQPGRRRAEILGGLLDPPGMQANLVPDGHLAAPEDSHSLCSTDGDFGRFPHSSRANPLLG